MQHIILSPFGDFCDTDVRLIHRLHEVGFTTIIGDPTMTNAFHRSIAIFSMISAARALPIAERVPALADIPQYYSRGKGRKYATWSTSGKPRSNKCNNCFDPPGYNGDKEMARRRRQMAKGMLTVSNGCVIAA